MTDTTTIESAAFRFAAYALRTPMLTSLALNAPPIDLWPPV